MCKKIKEKVEEKSKKKSEGGKLDKASNIVGWEKCSDSWYYINPCFSCIFPYTVFCLISLNYTISDLMQRYFFF